MFSLDMDVSIIVVLEVFKIWTSNLSGLITDKVNLALVAHDMGHSVTKVVVQVNSCRQYAT